MMEFPYTRVKKLFFVFLIVIPFSATVASDSVVIPDIHWRDTKCDGEANLNSFEGSGPRRYHRCVNVNGQMVLSSKICAKGLVYDKTVKKCVNVPGNGYALYIDYEPHCPNNYNGLLKHPTQFQYYYICRNSSTIVAKCGHLQLFDNNNKRCQPLPLSALCTIKIYDASQGTLEVPDCHANGRFSLPNDCAFYYICVSNQNIYYQYIHKCPGRTKYCPVKKYCTYNAKCEKPPISTPSWVFLEDPYPPCTSHGRFRSPTDCSLYYTCSVKTNGTFYQERFECPKGTIFSNEHKFCVSDQSENCTLPQPFRKWPFLVTPTVNSLQNEPNKIIKNYPEITNNQGSTKKSNHSDRTLQTKPSNVSPDLRTNYITRIITDKTIKDHTTSNRKHHTYQSPNHDKHFTPHQHSTKISPAHRSIKPDIYKNEINPLAVTSNDNKIPINRTHNTHSTKYSRSSPGTRIVTDKYGSTKTVTSPGDADEDNKETPEKPGTGHKTHLQRNHTTTNKDLPHGGKRSRTPHGTRIVTDKYGSTKIVTNPGDTDDDGKRAPSTPGASHKSHVPRNHTTISQNHPHDGKRSRAPHRTRIVTDKYGSTKIVTSPGDVDADNKETPEKPGAGHKTHVPRTHSTTSQDHPHGGKRSRSPHRTRIVTDKYGSTKIVTSPGDVDEDNKETPEKPGSGHKTHVPRNHSTISRGHPHGGKRSRSPHRTRIVMDKYGSTKIVTSPGDADEDNKETSEKPGAGHKTHVQRNHSTISRYHPHGGKHSRPPHRTRIVTDKYGSTKIVTSPREADDDDSEGVTQKLGTGHKTHLQRNQTTTNQNHPHGGKRSRTPYGTRIFTDKYGSTKIVTNPRDTDDDGKGAPQKPGASHKAHVPRNHTTIIHNHPHDGKRSRAPHRTKIVTDKYGSTKIVTSPGDADEDNKETPEKPGAGHKTHVPRTHSTTSRDHPHGGKRSRSPHRTRIVTDKYGSTKIVTSPGEADDDDSEGVTQKLGTGHKTHLQRNHTTTNKDLPHGGKRSRTPHGTRIVTDKYGSTKIITNPRDADDDGNGAPPKPGESHKAHVPRNHTTISQNHQHDGKRSRAPHRTRIVTDKYGSTKIVTSPGDVDADNKETPEKPGAGHKTHVPRTHSTTSQDHPHGGKRSRSPHRTRIVTDNYGSTKIVTSPGDVDEDNKETPEKPGSGHKTHVPRNHSTISRDHPHGGRRSRPPHRTRIVTDKYGSTKIVTSPGDADEGNKETPEKPVTGHKTHLQRNHTTTSKDLPHGGKRSRTPRGTRIVTDKYGSTKIITNPRDADDDGNGAPPKPGASHKAHVPRNHTTISQNHPHDGKRSRAPHRTRIVTDKYGSSKIVTSPGDVDADNKETPEKPGAGHKTHVPRTHSTTSQDHPHGGKRSRSPHRTRIVTDKYGSTKIVTSPGDVDEDNKETPEKPGSGHKTHVPRNHSTISRDHPHGGRRSRPPHRTRIVTDKYGSTKIVTSPGDADEDNKETPEKPGTGHKTYLQRNHTTTNKDLPHGGKRSQTPHRTRIVTDKYGSTKTVTTPGDTDDDGKRAPSNPGASHKSHVPRNHTTISQNHPHDGKRSRVPHRTRIVTDKYGSTKIVTSPGDADEGNKETPEKPETGHKTHLQRNHTTTSKDLPHSGKRSRTPRGTRIVTDKYGSTKIITNPRDADDDGNGAPPKPGASHKAHVPRNHTTISQNHPHDGKRSRAPHRTRIVTDKYGSSKIVTSPGDVDADNKETPEKPGAGHKTHVPRTHSTTSQDHPHGGKRSRSPHRTRIVTDKYGSSKIVTSPGDVDADNKETPEKPGAGHKTHVPRTHSTTSQDHPHGGKRSRPPHRTRIVTDKYGSTKIVTSPGDADEDNKETPEKPGTGHKTYLQRNHTTTNKDLPHGGKRSQTPHRTRIVTDKYGSTKTVTTPGDTDDDGKRAPSNPGASHKSHVPRNHTTISQNHPHDGKRSRVPHRTRIVTDKYGSTKIVTSPGDADEDNKETPEKPGAGHKTHVPRTHSTTSQDHPHGGKRSRSPHRTRIVTDKYGSTKIVTSPGDVDEDNKETPEKPGSGHKTHVPRNHSTISRDHPHGGRRSRPPHRTRIVRVKYGSTKIVTSPGDADEDNKETPEKPGTGHKTYLQRNHTTTNKDLPHGGKRSRTPHGTRIVSDKYGSTKTVTNPGDTDDDGKRAPSNPGASHKSHVPRNHTTISQNHPHDGKRSRVPHRTRIVTDKYGSTKIVTSPGDADEDNKETPEKPGAGHKTHVPRTHSTTSQDHPHGGKRSRSPHRTRIVTDKYGSTKIVTSPGDVDEDNKETPEKPGSGHKTHVTRNHSTISRDHPHGGRRSRPPHRTRIVTDKYGSTKIVTSPGDADEDNKETPEKPGTGHKTYLQRNHTTTNKDLPHGGKRSRTPHGTRIVSDKYGSTKTVTNPGDTDDDGKRAPSNPGASHKSHVPRNHTTISQNHPHDGKRSRVPHRTRIVTDKYGSTKIVTSPGDADEDNKETPEKPGAGHKTHVPRTHSTTSQDHPHGGKRSRSPHRTRIVTDKYGSTKIVTSPGDVDEDNKETPEKPGSGHKTHVPRNHSTISRDHPHGGRLSRPPHRTRIVRDKYGSTKIVTSPGDADEDNKETPEKPGTGHKTYLQRNHTTTNKDLPHGGERSRTPHGTRFVTDKYGSTKIVTNPGDTDDDGKRAPSNPGASHKSHVPRNHTTISQNHPHDGKRSRAPYRTRIVTDKYGSTKIVTSPGDVDADNKETPEKPGAGHKTHVPRTHSTTSQDHPHGGKRSRSPHRTRIVTDKYGSTKIVTSPGDVDEDNKETPEKPGSGHKTHVPRKHSTTSRGHPHGGKRSRSPHRTRIVTDKYGSTKIVTSPGDVDEDNKETPEKPGSGHKTHVPRKHSTTSRGHPHGGKRSRSPHRTRIVTDKYGSTKIVTSPREADDDDSEGVTQKLGTGHKTHLQRNQTTTNQDHPHGGKRSRTPHGTRIVTDKYGSTKIVTNPGDTDDDGKGAPQKPGVSHKAHVPRNHTTIIHNNPHDGKRSRAPHRTKIVTDKYGSTKIVTSPGDADEDNKEIPEKPGAGHKTHVPRTHSTTSRDHPHGGKRSRSPHRTRIVTDKYGSTKIVTSPGEADDDDSEGVTQKLGTGHKTHLQRNHTTTNKDLPHGGKRSRTPHGTRIVTDKYGSTKIVTSPGDVDEGNKETSEKPGSGHKTHVPRNHSTISRDHPHGGIHSRPPHRTRIVTDKYGSSKIVTSTREADDDDSEDVTQKLGTGHKTHLQRNQTTTNQDHPHGGKRSRTPHGTRIVTDKYGSTKIVTNPGDTDDDGKGAPQKPGASHKAHVPRNHITISQNHPHDGKRSRAPHKPRIVTDKYGSTKIVTSPGAVDEDNKETPEKPVSGHKTHVPRTHSTTSRDHPHGGKRSRSPHKTRIATGNYGSTKIVTSPGDANEDNKETSEKPRARHKTHVPRNHSTISRDHSHDGKRSRAPHRPRIVTDKYGSTKIVTSPGDVDEDNKETPEKPVSGHKTHVPRTHSISSRDHPHGGKRSRSPHRTRIATDNYGSTKIVTSPGDANEDNKETPEKPGAGHKTHVPRTHSTTSRDHPHGGKRSRSPHRIRIVTDKYGSTKIVTSPEDVDEDNKETPEKPVSGHKTHIPRNHSTTSRDHPHGGKRSRSPHRTRILTDNYGSTKIVTSPGDANEDNKETPEKPRAGHKTHVPRNYSTISRDHPHGGKHSRPPHRTRIVTDKYGSTKIVTSPGAVDDDDSEGVTHKFGTGHKTHLQRNHTTTNKDVPHGAKRSRTPHGTRIVTDKYESKKVVTNPRDSDDDGNGAPQKPGASHKAHVPRNHTTISQNHPHDGKRSRASHRTRIVTDKYGSTKIVTSPGDAAEDNKETSEKPGSEHKTHVPRYHSTTSRDHPHGGKHSRSPHRTRIETDKYGSTKIVTSPGDVDDDDNEGVTQKLGTGHKTRLQRNHTTTNQDHPHGGKLSRTPHGTRIVTDKYGSTKIVTNPGDTDDDGKEAPQKPGASHKAHVPRNHTTISQNHPHDGKRSRDSHRTRIVTDKYGSTKIVTSPGDAAEDNKETSEKPGSGHKTHVPRNHSTTSRDHPHGGKHSRSPHRTRIVTDKYGSTKIVTSPGDANEDNKETSEKPGAGHKTHVPRNHSTISRDYSHGGKHSRPPHRTRIVTDKYGSTKIVTNPGDNDEDNKETPEKSGSGHKTHVPRNHSTTSRDHPHGGKHSRSPHRTRIETDKYGSTKIVTSPGDVDDDDNEGVTQKLGTGHKTRLQRNHTTTNQDHPHGGKLSRTPHGTRIVTDKYGSTKIVTNPGDTDDDGKEAPQKPGASHKAHVPRNHTTISQNHPHDVKRSRDSHRTRIVTDKYGSTKIVTSPGDAAEDNKETSEKPGSGHKTHVPRNHSTTSRDHPHGGKHSRSPHRTRIVTDKYGSTKIVTSPGDANEDNKETSEKPGAGHKTHVPRNHSTISRDYSHGGKHSRPPHRTRIVTDKYGSTKIVTNPGDNDEDNKETPEKPGSGHKTHVPRNHSTTSRDHPHGGKRSRPPHRTRIVTDKYGSTKIVTSPGDADDDDNEGVTQKLGNGHKTRLQRNHTTTNQDHPHGAKRSRTPHGTRIVTDKYGSTKIVTNPGDTDDDGKGAPQKLGASHKTHKPRNHTTISQDHPHSGKHSRSPHGTRIITDKYGSTKVVTNPGDADDNDKETPEKPVSQNHPHGGKHSRSPHGTRIITDKYGSTKVVTNPGDADDNDKETPEKPVSQNHPHGGKRSRSPHRTRIVTDKYGSTKIVTSPGETDGDDSEGVTQKLGTGHKTRLQRNHTTTNQDHSHSGKRSRTPHGTRIVTDKYGSTKIVTNPGDTDDDGKGAPQNFGASHKTHKPRNHTTISQDHPHSGKHSRSPHGTRIITDKYGSTKDVTNPGDADDNDKETPEKPVSQNHPHGGKRSRSPHGTRIITDKYGSTKVVTNPGDADDNDKETPEKTVSQNHPHGGKRSRSPHRTRIVTDKYGSTQIVTSPGDADDDNKETSEKPGAGHKTHLPRNHSTTSGDHAHGGKRSRSPHRTRIVTDKYGSTKIVTSPGETDGDDSEGVTQKLGTGHKTRLQRNHTTTNQDHSHSGKRSRTPHGTRIVTYKYGSTKIVTNPGDTDDDGKGAPQKPGASHKTHKPRHHTSISQDHPHSGKHSRSPHVTRIITDKYGSTKVVTNPGDADDNDKETPEKPVSQNHPHGGKRSRSPHGTRIITDKYGSTKLVTSPGDTDDYGKGAPQKPGASHKTHIPRNHTTISQDHPHSGKRSRSPHGTRIITDKYGSTKVVTPGDVDEDDKETSVKPGASHKTHVPRNHTTSSQYHSHGGQRSKSSHSNGIFTDKYRSTKVVTSPDDTNDNGQATLAIIVTDYKSTDKYGSSIVTGSSRDTENTVKHAPNKLGEHHTTHAHGNHKTPIARNTKIITTKKDYTMLPTEKDSDNTDIKEYYQTSRIPEISNQKRSVKDTRPPRSSQSTSRVRDHSTRSVKTRRTPSSKNHSDHVHHTREGHTKPTHQEKTHKDITHHNINVTGTLSTKIHQTHKSRVTKVVKITQATDKDHHVVTHPRNRTHQAHKNHTTHVGNHTVAPHTHRTHDYRNATVKDVQLDNYTKIGYTIKIKSYTFLNNDTTATDIDGLHRGFTESPNCTRSGTFLYSKDCKKYFLCKVGKTTLFDFEIYECKEGLIYSQKYKICVSLNFETCTFEVFVPHFKPPTTALPSSKEKVKCRDPGIFAFNDSCKSYYICEKMNSSDLQVNVQQCPPNTNFDIQYKKCLPERLSKCNRIDDGLIQPSKTYTSSKDLLKTTGISIKNTEFPVTEVSPMSQKNNTNECPESDNDCPHVGAFRIKNSCHEYFECTYDRKCDRLVKTDTLVCPKCLRFNPVVGLCDYPHNVPECAPKMPDKYNCTGPGTFKVSKDCTQYVVCEKTSSGTYKSTRKHCSKSHNFNPSTLQCEENFECFVKKPKCTSPGFFVNEHTCELYYQCVELDDDGNFDVVEHECPPNLLFDVDKQYCDFPDKVKGCQIEHHTIKPPILPKPK